MCPIRTLCFTIFLHMAITLANRLMQIVQVSPKFAVFKVLVLGMHVVDIICCHTLWDYPWQNVILEETFCLATLLLFHLLSHYSTNYYGNAIQCYFWRLSRNYSCWLIFLVVSLVYGLMNCNSSLNVKMDLDWLKSYTNIYVIKINNCADD